MVQKADINAIIEDYLDDEPCYCDHGCMDVGDCCPDFKDYCGGEFKSRVLNLVDHRSASENLGTLYVR